MNKPTLPDLENKTSALTAMARLDWESAQLIEEGIKLQGMYGTQHAADFLKDRRININTALRVLLEPDKRRTYAKS